MTEFRPPLTLRAQLARYGIVGIRAGGELLDLATIDSVEIGDRPPRHKVRMRLGTPAPRGRITFDIDFSVALVHVEERAWHVERAPRVERASTVDRALIFEDRA